MLQKLGAFKNGDRPWNDNSNAMAMEPESPGEVPKSIINLDRELDHALRVACTGVLRNNKPSHEYHKGGKAQLDYATIRRGGGNNPAPAPRKQDPVPTMSLSKSMSNEDKVHRPNRDSTMSNGLPNPEMSHRISHISASMDQYSQTSEEDPQAQAQTQKQRSRAQSRADQLMAGPAAENLALNRPRTNSHHSRSQSTPQGFWNPAPQLVKPKFGSLRRPKPAPRAYSTENTVSPLSDPRMANPWAMPAPYATGEDGTIESWIAGPEQASSGAAEVKKDVEVKEAEVKKDTGAKRKTSDMDAEWMHDASERDLLLQQQAFADTALSRHATRILPKPDEVQSNDTEQESQLPTSAVKVPERKPVPTAQVVASPDTGSCLASPTFDTATHGSASPPEQLTAAEQPLQVPTVQRSDSRNGRGRTRGNGIPTNTRALSRARSVTRDVKDFIRNASRNASRSRQPRSNTDEPQPRSRRPSISDNIRDYFRPGTAQGKHSLDVPPNLANLKAKSHESFVSARSDTSQAKDTPMQLSQRSSRHNKNSSSSTGRNSFEPGGEDAQRNGSTSESKRAVDLNRALPPLPRLESWHDDTFMTPGSIASIAPESPKHALDSPKVTDDSPKNTLEPPRNPRDSSLPSPTISSAMKRISSRESRSPLPSPKLAGVHDYVAMRMGAPVARQSSSRAKVRENQWGNPNLTQQSQRPAMSRRAPTDPKDARSQPSDYGFPSSSSQAKQAEITAARRRSKSVHDLNAPDMSEKLRTASANSPDGRSIHAVGQAKIVDTTLSPRGQFDGLAGKIGRKLSTRRRNITPTLPQHPPPPPPHLELPQRRAKTATSTPDGLSRANSTYHAKKRTDKSRKMSMDESGHKYDGRFHKNNEDLMTPPPPIAVPSSKGSPRMNLGNFLPSKFQPQQQQQGSQQSGSKKWWQLGLSGGDNMDSAPRSGAGMDHANGGLGVRY
jgi:hypothetical protein